MSVKQRLKTYLKVKGETQEGFGKKIGVTKGYVSAIAVSVPPEKLLEIAMHYPDLNIGWLLTGMGEMIIETKENENEVGEGAAEYKNRTNELIESIKQENDTLRGQITFLQDVIRRLQEEK